MNYTIIKDRDKLIDFINWLPELEPSEVFYVSLLARNKYVKDLKKDKISLKRFTADKKYLLNKIEQLEVPIGCYRYGNDDLPIPEEALALYITPNPRDLVTATKNLVKVAIDKVFGIYDGYNPQSLSLSEIQKANGVVKFFDFDFDFVSLDETIGKIKECVNLDACTFIRTFGGFHLLVEINKVSAEFRKSWNPRITKINGCDVRGTSMLLPVVGCTAGNFIPHFVKV